MSETKPRIFYHSKPLRHVAGDAVSCHFLPNGDRVTTVKETGQVRIDRVRT